MARVFDDHYWMQDTSKGDGALFDMSPLMGPNHRQYGSPPTHDFPRVSLHAAKDTFDKKSSIYKIMRADQKKRYMDYHP
jgi:hypothetical protein